ncbi:hypothetical protein BV898_01955 [Hypsibius exemplaris]|uniref:Uncharacterized protein n=1 Tax=Hypsibius exemplaris TaxID=2072580 RepID=A0A1W0X8X3_HYPEX|nr:hypothetical protein BV898_01955 [Hypsibius exemplaris]
MTLSTVVVVLACLAAVVVAQQATGSAGASDKQQFHQAKETLVSEPAAAESNSYGQYGGKYGGRIDPRYYDRGDTPHFGLAGFPFGYERRYNGQNVVYDNSLAGFPLNYYNYQQQDYGNSYNSYKPSYSKPQYRSAAYTAPKSYLPSAYPAPQYGAYLGKPAQNDYYSLQYGY